MLLRAAKWHRRARMRPPLAPLVLAALTALASASFATSPGARTRDAAPPPPSDDGATRDTAAGVSGRDDDASYPVELGTFSTTLLGSTPARTQNIRLAARALDSIVL